jgi:hypothetical protein
VYGKYCLGFIPQTYLHQVQGGKKYAQLVCNLTLFSRCSKEETGGEVGHDHVLRSESEAVWIDYNLYFTCTGQFLYAIPTQEREMNNLDLYYGCWYKYSAFQTRSSGKN